MSNRFTEEQNQLINFLQHQKCNGRPLEMTMQKGNAPVTYCLIEEASQGHHLRELLSAAGIRGHLGNYGGELAFIVSEGTNVLRELKVLHVVESANRWQQTVVGGSPAHTLSLGKGGGGGGKPAPWER